MKKKCPMKKNGRNSTLSGTSTFPAVPCRHGIFCCFFFVFNATLEHSSVQLRPERKKNKTHTAGGPAPKKSRSLGGCSGSSVIKERPSWKPKTGLGKRWLVCCESKVDKKSDSLFGEISSHRTSIFILHLPRFISQAVSFIFMILKGRQPISWSRNVSSFFSVPPDGLKYFYEPLWRTMDGNRINGSRKLESRVDPSESGRRDSLWRAERSRRGRGGWRPVRAARPAGWRWPSSAGRAASRGLYWTTPAVAASTAASLGRWCAEQKEKRLVIHFWCAMKVRLSSSKSKITFKKTFTTTKCLHG